MNLKAYLRSLNSKVVVADRKSILRYIIPKDTDKEEFRNFLAIGCWYDGHVAKKFEAVNFKRSLGRINSILEEHKNIDKTDTLVLLCRYPVVLEQPVHFVEYVMPLVRKHGFSIYKEEFAYHEDGYVNILKLTTDGKKNKKLNDLYAKTKAWDFIRRYTVDRDEGVIMAEAIFKIVGINMTKDTRKLANQLCKKYPKLRYGEGCRPEINLKRIPYTEDFKHDYAVAINLKIQGKEYRIGWLSANEEEILEGYEVVPNKLICELMTGDGLSDNKVILGYKLSSFGSFEKEGKRLYWGKIIVELNLDNIEG